MAWIRTWFQNDRGRRMVVARTFSSLGSLDLYHFMSRPNKEGATIDSRGPKSGIPDYRVGASLHLLNRLARSAGDTKAYLENFLKCVQKWTWRIFENL